MAANNAPAEFRRIRLVLGRSPHFNKAPAKHLDRLARLGRIEHYKDGELIHAAWQPMDKAWLVLTGGLRVALLGEDGSATPIAVIGEGSYYSAGSLVKGEVVESEAHAIGRTQAAVFDMSRVDREFAGDKWVEQEKLRLVFRRLMAATEYYRDAVGMPLPQRMARRLLGQALAAGRGAGVELPVSQADLAEMLGASRTKVNAELRRLEESGAVRLGYRKIVVRDMTRLCAAAGTGVMPL
ncbi:MAG: Crp/Fnr family transcriptional regulator [Betaproteobacteria bacterium]|nr:MAG: Crp/Fnr family transcriptional regulator [Betaproteobacteria bacterium]